MRFCTSCCYILTICIIYFFEIPRCICIGYFPRSFYYFVFSFTKIPIEFFILLFLLSFITTIQSKWVNLCIGVENIPIQSGITTRQTYGVLADVVSSLWIIVPELLILPFFKLSKL